MSPLERNLPNVLMNLWALSEYGHHASNALPILSNLEHYPVGNIQEAAREAAAKIRADKLVDQGLAPSTRA